MFAAMVATDRRYGMEPTALPLLEVLALERTEL
jgi:hypothetical protein